jgi:hypothetical protein
MLVRGEFGVHGGVATVRRWIANISPARAGAREVGSGHILIGAEASYSTG